MTEPILIEPGIVNDVLQAILDACCECLELQTLAGRPKDCFISHTRPPDDCGDSLSIWCDLIEPTDDFPNPSTTYQPCGHEVRMVSASIKLVRPCWPGLKENPNSPFPEAVTETQPAAEALLIDANVLWCCLNGALTDPEVIGEQGRLAMIEEIRPDAPRGGVAGWTLKFKFELSSCC